MFEIFTKKLHFVQPDIQIIYRNDNVPYKYYSNGGVNYYILYFQKGKAQIKYDNRIYYLKPGDFFIASRKEVFTFEYGSDEYEFLEIRFASKITSSLEKDFDILKPFRNIYEFKIYNIDTKGTHLKSAINTIIRVLSQRNGRFFVLSAINQLLCEIYFNHQQKNPSAILESDSNFSKIATYIEAHLFEKITLKDVANNTFISPRCVTDTVRRVCNLSFHELLIKNRLEQAEWLIHGPSSIQSIAAMCGFETYSTFYRAFVKKNKISPTEYRQRIKNNT